MAGRETTPYREADALAIIPSATPPFPIPRRTFGKWLRGLFCLHSMGNNLWLWVGESREWISVGSGQGYYRVSIAERCLTCQEIRFVYRRNPPHDGVYVDREPDQK